jgi:hypothetical protein
VTEVHPPGRSFETLSLVTTERDGYEGQLRNRALAARIDTNTRLSPTVELNFIPDS